MIKLDLDMLVEMGITTTIDGTDISFEINWEDNGQPHPLTKVLQAVERLDISGATYEEMEGQLMNAYVKDRMMKATTYKS